MSAKDPNPAHAGTVHADTTPAVSRSGRAADIRQQCIIETLKRDGHVEVAELSNALEVTEETIRRDLRVLERRGLLRRAHGGAIRISNLANDLNALLETTVPEYPIARAALEYVPSSGSIYLDAGRQTESLAGMFSTLSGVQIVTSSVPAALAASRNSALDVYNLGGEVSADDGAEFGQWAREELARVRVDVGFLCAGGLSADAYLTAATPKLASIKRAALDASAFVVLLAEDGGLDVGGLVKFAPLSAVDVVILGADAAESLVALVSEHGPVVRVATAEHEEP